MPDLILAIDHDGTLENEGPLAHYAGISRVGLGIWNTAEKCGWLRRVMAGAKLDPLACKILFDAHNRGWQIVDLTARTERLAGATRVCLDRNGLQFVKLWTRPSAEKDIIRYKTAALRQLGATVYLDDQLDLCLGVLHVLKGESPLVLQFTDWEIVPAILRLVEGNHAI